MSRINIDFINVLHERDERVEFSTVAIPKDADLIADLTAMVGNPNRTVLDMQHRMGLAFHPNNRRAYGYIAPYSYSSSYIDSVVYPKEMSLENYENRVRDIEERLSQKDFSSEDLSVRMEEELKKIKSAYLINALNYIDAYSYFRKVGELRKDDSIRMYSTESIGWSNFSFVVTDDVSIEVMSNFGYGSSSYFFVNLTYKGIEILPYSYWVKYYYADKESLMRYTRNYMAIRSSWDDVFTFVMNVANEAKDVEDNFVNKFILEEVNEMLRGLRKIMACPINYLTDCYQQRHQESKSNIVGIWHMSDDFGVKYNVYRSELAMAVMAEKITGSIDFLENLQKFSVILPQLQEAINEIKQMAVGILPRISATISDIQGELHKRGDKLDVKEKELVEVESLLVPHESNIDILYNEAQDVEKQKEEDSRKTIGRFTIEAAYKIGHEDYTLLCERKEKLTDEISDLKMDICLRKEFENRLEACVKVVNDKKKSWGI